VRCAPVAWYYGDGGSVLSRNSNIAQRRNCQIVKLGSGTSAVVGTVYIMGRNLVFKSDIKNT